MAASSVTGVSGPGDSNGKYKPENNCSCSCCCSPNKNPPEQTVVKTGCYKKYKSCRNYSYKSGGVLKIKTC